MSNKDGAHNYLPETKHYSHQIKGSLLDQDEAPDRGAHGSTNSNNYQFKSMITMAGEKPQRAGINATVISESD
jgi:hypothetical protein